MPALWSARLGLLVSVAAPQVSAVWEAVMSELRVLVAVARWVHEYGPGALFVGGLLAMFALGYCGGL